MAAFVINNRQAPIDFEIKESVIQRVVQNAKNLLMTQMGEVPYDRYRGMNPALYDLPIKEMREALLPEMDRVMLWEPDVEVADAACSMDENGDILIVVTLEINLIE